MDRHLRNQDLLPGHPPMVTEPSIIIIIILSRPYILTLEGKYIFIITSIHASVSFPGGEFILT